MNVINILNTIRDNSSEMYQKRIPEAVKNNILDIQKVMADPNNAILANQFISVLLNMVIKQEIHTKNFVNPLKPLKKGKKPIGDTIEEIYNNYVQAKGFDPSGSELLTREMPDVKAVYHKMNDQRKYKVTISAQQLAKAFSSYDNLEKFITDIINTLSKSNELDEFILMKSIIQDAMDNNAVKICSIADPCLSESNAKAFIKAINIVSGDMQFPNDRNNAWLSAQSTDSKPIITNSSLQEQILIIDNATNVNVNLEVLAKMFNMSLADFNNTRKIVIDSFTDPSVRAILCDEAFFQAWEDLLTFKKFENGEGLYDNYYLHAWNTMAYSPLVNAMVFQVSSDEDSDGTVEEFTITKSLKTGVTSTNTRTKVTEGSSYQTTLKGVKSTDSVSVTMGTTIVESVETPVDITSDVYDSETGKINIPIVTANVTITVS